MKAVVTLPCRGSVVLLNRGPMRRSSCTNFRRLSTGAAGTNVGSRINHLIPVQEEGKKITDRLTLKAGDRVVLCRCWLSKKWPICDGSHGPHNRATGDNVGPAVVTVGEQDWGRIQSGIVWFIVYTKVIFEIEAMNLLFAPVVIRKVIGR